MKIYYECDNDGVLLDIFLIPKNRKEHSHSKGNVCNKVSKNNGVTGLVDEDPQTRQPTYISNLRSPIASNYNIKIFRDAENNNKIVMLSPRLEEWLYDTAGKNGINPEDFELPSKPEDLHKLEFRKVKTKLKNFLSALLKSSEFSFLKSHIT